MKRLLALIAGGLGLGTLLRHRQQRSTVELGPSPADDLRAKLAQSRSLGDSSSPAVQSPAAESFEADEPRDGEGASAEDEIAARRRSVHDRARDAIDELG